MKTTTLRKPRELTPKQRAKRRVGYFLRRMREEVPLTQEELAKALGWDNRQSVSNKESGKRGVELHEAIAIYRVVQKAKEIGKEDIEALRREAQMITEDDMRNVVVESSVHIVADAQGARGEAKYRRGDKETDLIDKWNRLPAKKQKLVESLIEQFLEEE